ncbi:hypothetical protein D3C78_1438790 [compost metagenome]
MFDTTPIIEPSLGPRTICAVPVMPPAPGRFSITTGWPAALASWVLIARIAPSAPEPADSGRITRKGLSPCASAPRGASRLAAARARMRRRGVVGKCMVCLLLFFMRNTKKPAHRAGSGDG